jgi:hypothetical protein
VQFKIINLNIRYHNINFSTDNNIEFVPLCPILNYIFSSFELFNDHTATNLLVIQWSQIFIFFEKLNFLDEVLESLKALLRPVRLAQDRDYLVFFVEWFLVFIVYYIISSSFQIQLFHFYEIK